MNALLKMAASLAGTTALMSSTGFASLSVPTNSAGLFVETNTWTVCLKFSPEQWEQMEPHGGNFPGGPGGPRPGGPGSGGPGGFSPAMIVVPAFLQAGQNGKISREEFCALGEKWFSQWDTNNAGKLTAQELKAGLNAAFGPPGFGHPGGPGPQSAQGKRNGMSAASGLDFKYVHADLEFEGQSITNVAARYKGNNTFMESRNSIKRSLKIDLNKFSKEQTFAELSKINLHNNVTDASWMNEVLSHQLFRDAGVPAPRTSYARIYVTVPGKYDKKYFGLYSIVENIDARFAADRHYESGGAIFKPVERDMFTDLGTNWSAYQKRYDPKTKTTPEQEHRVMEFAHFVTSTPDAEFAAHLADYLDLDEFARFMAVTVWLSNMDSILAMGQNYYVYLNPRTQKFEFWPWDLDHSFGQFPMAGSQEQREGLSLETPWRGENRFLERVFKVDAFKKIYLAHMKEFSDTIFKPERFYQQVDALASALRPSVKMESEAMLSRFDKVVAGQAVAAQRGGPEGGPMRGPGGPGFMQASEPIKGFVTARARSVQDQLSGVSGGQTLSDFGGPGGPGGFGPAMFLERPFMDSLDADHDGAITHEEFSAGFAKWFDQWDTQKSGVLLESQLRVGVEKSLLPARASNFPPPGFGPPDGDLHRPPPEM